MNQRSDLHHIQRGIILSLTTQSPLRFTDLRPPRIPNNTFSYHLKKLVDAGYVKSSDDSTGYVLTRKALKLVGFTNTQAKRVATPALITILYITNSEGETLLLNRDMAPFRGWYGLPSGTIHLGETVDEAARRELSEKTGISETVPIKQVGVLDFQYRKEDADDLFAHAVAMVYACRYRGDKDSLNDSTTRFGQLSWSKLGRRLIRPEVQAVKEMAESGEFSTRSVSFVEPDGIPVLAD